MGSPSFACRISPEGQDRACAGWLAVTGADHVGVRIDVLTGQLDPGRAAARPVLAGTLRQLRRVGRRPTPAQPTAPVPVDGLIGSGIPELRHEAPRRVGSASGVRR